jgi:hypothetical protein
MAMKVRQVIKLIEADGGDPSTLRRRHHGDPGAGRVT